MRGILVGHAGLVDYRGRVPAAPLDLFIDDIYVLSGEPTHRRLNVPPMPSAHLFINLAEPVTLVDSLRPSVPTVFTDAWFMGVWTRRFEIEFDARVRVVGVHFKPWGLSPFVRVPSHEVRDRWIPAEAQWDASSPRLRERLGSAATPAIALQILEAELRSQLVAAPPRGLELVNHTAVRLERSWGALPISSLADGAGISGNHLATQYASHVGVTPKRLARIYRFARLILSVDARHPVDWPVLAQTAGFFDQAHLSKEFKEFTGQTPTDYLALRRRFPSRQGFPPDAGPMPAMDFLQDAPSTRRTG